MFKRVLSGIAALAVTVSGLPALHTMAAEITESDTALEILGESPVYTNRGMCYRIYHASNANWLDEQQFCMEQGGTLVRIDDEEEQRVIEKMAADYAEAHPDETFDGMDIGLFRVDRNKWTWFYGFSQLDGDSYTNWDENQPDNCKGIEKYAGLYTKTIEYDGWTATFGKWNDCDGDTRNDSYFLCEWYEEVYDKEYPVFTTEELKNVQVYNGHSYLIAPNFGTFYSTEAFAEANGAHLVSVNSAGEQAFIEEMVADYLVDHPDETGICLGACHSVTNSGPMKWIDGSEFTYQNWDDLQPDNWLGIECFCVLNTDDGTWNDRNGNYGCSILEWDRDLLAPETVSITYKANGGSGSDVVQEHVSGESVALKAANTFTRSGYTFTGWNSKADGSGNTYAAGATVAWQSNVTLYAQWKKNAVNITYKANGGSGSDVVQSHAPGEAVALKAANTFTRSGYTFTGWNSKADGSGNTYAAGATVAWQSNVTLYAQWKKNAVSITYKANGGSGSDVVQSHISGEAVTLKAANTFTRSGYTFTGWNSKADGSGNTYAADTKVTWFNNVTLYAQWAPQRTITYKANGGNGYDIVQKHGAGVKVSLFANGFTRSGYTFTGWNSKADGSGNTYAAGTEVAWKNNVVLYAQWKKNLATITYKANGADGSDVIQSHISGEAVTLKGSNTFNRAGYVFVGWNTKPDGSGNTYAADAKVAWRDNVTLYAMWEVQQSLIIYRANDGTNRYAEQEHPMGEKTNLVGDIFTRSGYTFIGWNTKPDGSGNTYAADAEVAWRDDVTLYAMWKKK